MIQHTKLKPVPMAGNSNFTLDVVIGDAQPSSTSVFLMVNLYILKAIHLIKC